MNHFPGRHTRIDYGVPVRWQFIRTEQSHISTLRRENSRIHHADNTCVLGYRERLSNTVRAYIKPRLFKPCDSPACIRIEVALLISQCLVECVVYESQCIAHRQWFACGVEHMCITSVNSHAGSDCGLSQVHRSNIAAL